MTLLVYYNKANPSHDAIDTSNRGLIALILIEAEGGFEHETPSNACIGS